MSQPSEDVVTDSNHSRPTRSRKGCPECRKRKIKCDESRPQCGQCQRSGRTCRILDSLFKQHAYSFQTGVSAPEQRNATRPSQIIGIGSQDEYGDDSSHQAEFLDGASNLGAPLEPIPTDGSLFVHQDGAQSAQNHARDTATPTVADRVAGRVADQTLTDGQLANEASPNSYRSFHLQSSDGLVAGPGAYESSPSTASFPEPHRTNRISVSSPKGSLSESDEEQFFLRHYSENSGRWMDVVNTEHFFSQRVLLLARDNLLVKYSVCAVAAKQLGQLDKPLLKMSRTNGQRHVAKTLLEDAPDYLWYGAKYYELAIQLLAQQISRRDFQGSHSSPSEVYRAGLTPQTDYSPRAEDEDPGTRLLAACLLIQYESLSATMRAWLGHLDGFFRLLRLIDNEMLFQPRPIAHEACPCGNNMTSVQAAFWYFTINDLEESFVSQHHTRVDTDNLSLWRNMGLLLDERGQLILDALAHGLPFVPQHVQDDLISYAFIRLLCKLVNYQASYSGNERGPPPLMPAPLSPRNDGQIAQFSIIERELDACFDMLPASFQPDTVWRCKQGGSHGASAEIFGKETWFSNNFRATTMMYYHMARMLLLIHRPIELLLGDASSGRLQTQFDLLLAYRNVEHNLRNHAAEIISIALGMPEDASRARAIQPLYVAGRCLTEKTERGLLIEMLKDIEVDLGTATEYRIENLLQEWGVSYESLHLQ